jgi:hypothetical protein
MVLGVVGLPLWFQGGQSTFVAMLLASKMLSVVACDALNGTVTISSDKHCGTYASFCSSQFITAQKAIMMIPRQQ